MAAITNSDLKLVAMFDNLVTETYLQILFLFFINKQVWSSLLEFRLQDTTFEFDYPYCFVVAEFKGLYLTQALCWDSASETISLIATRIVVMNPWSNALRLECKLSKNLSHYPALTNSVVPYLKLFFSLRHFVKHFQSITQISGFYNSQSVSCSYLHSCNRISSMIPSNHKSEDVVEAGTAAEWVRESITQNSECL